MHENPSLDIPKAFLDECELTLIIHDGCVYAEIIGGMCGLPQVVKSSYDQLIRRLMICGSEPNTLTPGIWINKRNGVTFTIAVEELGVKHASEIGLIHLMQALRDKCIVTVDRTRNLYCRIVLE